MQVDTCRNFHDMNAVRSKILKSDHPDDDISGRAVTFSLCSLKLQEKSKNLSMEFLSDDVKIIISVWRFPFPKGRNFFGSCEWLGLNMGFL